MLNTISLPIWLTVITGVHGHFFNGFGTSYGDRGQGSNAAGLAFAGAQGAEGWESQGEFGYGHENADTYSSNGRYDHSASLLAASEQTSANAEESRGSYNMGGAYGGSHSGQGVMSAMGDGGRYAGREGSYGNLGGLLANGFADIFGPTRYSPYPDCGNCGYQFVEAASLPEPVFVETASMPDPVFVETGSMPDPVFVEHPIELPINRPIERPINRPMNPRYFRRHQLWMPAFNFGGIFGLGLGNFGPTFGEFF